MANRHSVSPNFVDGYNGRLAVDRYQYQGHVSGASDKHAASSITLSPGVTNLPGTPTNVQGAFSALDTYIGQQASRGQGFVTVGDGYDTYAGANASGAQIYYDKNVLALNILLTPIFNAILAGTDLATTQYSAYVRIQRGGIIVIKSGTYIITDTIPIPPGMTLMGEGFGTKIVNATSLNLTVQPPTVNGSGTPKALFQIKTATPRVTTDGAIDGSPLMFSRQTKICNMVICDNFVEPTQSFGDNSYKTPQNSAAGAPPLFLQEGGSNLYLDNVMILGRVSYSSGKIVASATQCAIGSTTISGSGTMLQIDKCTIDGFSQPISFQHTGFAQDFVEVTNSKIRFHGYFGGAGNGSAPSTNCALNSNSANIRIINNHVFGNHVNARTILYLNTIETSTTDIQSYPKILITSNDFVQDKGVGNGSVTFQTYFINSTYSAPYKLVIFDAWNNFQSLTPMNVSNPLTLGSSLYVFGSSEFVGNTKFDAAISKRIITVSSTSYTVDSSIGDCMILVNTTSNPVSITLPVVTNGRELVIKDIGGNAQTNNITLIRNGGVGSIDGYTGSRVLSTNKASWTLMGDTVNGDNASWWIV